MVMFGEFTADTGNEALNDLLTRGGMVSMLSTIWLVVSAMMFGAAMEKTGITGCDHKNDPRGCPQYG